MHTTGLRAAVRGHGDHHGEGSGRGDLHYHRNRDEQGELICWTYQQSITQYINHFVLFYQSTSLCLDAAPAFVPDPTRSHRGSFRQ